MDVVPPKIGAYAVSDETPVPPSETAMSVPFQTPVETVPTLVKEDAVTPEFRVVPVSVPAAAVTVIAAVPSKDTPLIARAVWSAVAVPALPVTEV